MIPPTAGKLSFCIGPSLRTWKDTQNEQVIWLDLTFTGSDQDALHKGFLDVNGGRAVFPMLYRIDDMYEDVVYTEHEAKDLRNECLRVKEIREGQTEIGGLDKLLYACEKAMSKNYGIYMASD